MTIGCWSWRARSEVGRSDRPTLYSVSICLLILFVVGMAPGAGRDGDFALQAVNAARGALVSPCSSCRMTPPLAAAHQHFIRTTLVMTTVSCRLFACTAFPASAAACSVRT